MRRHVWTALGVVLIVLGIGLYALAQPVAGDYGWFAYTPLSDAGPSIASSGDLVFLTRGRAVALAVAGLGLLVLTAALAYRAGRRRSPT